MLIVDVISIVEIRHGLRHRKGFNMKRILVVLLIILSIISCTACRNSKSENDTIQDQADRSYEENQSNTDENNMIQYESVNFYDENQNESNQNDGIAYETGIFHDKNWSETVGTYSEAVIPDKETALKIAKAIFDGMEKSDDMKKCVPCSIFYDNQDEVWIVSFANPPEQVPVTVGGGCSIALQKKDGKVLRIWFGE